MCKFHKDVAIDVATNPVSGVLCPLRYSITLCALAKFWVDKYMPDMGHLDGYSNYEMSTAATRHSFALSDLEKDPRKVHDGQAERIIFLRGAVDKVIADLGLTPQLLNLPKSPDTSPRFLDQVMLGMYDGEPQHELTIKASVDNPKHEPLRHVVEHIYKISGYGHAVEQSLRSNISALVLDAPHKINPHLLSAYNRFPQGLRTAFGSCSLHGGGGALAHVVVCGGLNSAIGGFSGVFMNAAMYAVGPAVALASTYAVERYRLNDFNPYKYVLPVALSLGAAFGVSQFLPHEHSADPKMGWFYNFSPAQRHDELQRQYQRYLGLSESLRQDVDKESARQDMTVAMFMTSLSVCGGDLTPRIAAYERESQQQTLTPVLK